MGQNVKGNVLLLDASSTAQDFDAAFEEYSQEAGMNYAGKSAAETDKLDNLSGWDGGFEIGHTYQVTKEGSGKDYTKQGNVTFTLAMFDVANPNLKKTVAWRTVTNRTAGDASVDYDYTKNGKRAKGTAKANLIKDPVKNRKPVGDGALKAGIRDGKKVLLTYLGYTMTLFTGNGEDEPQKLHKFAREVA